MDSGALPQLQQRPRSGQQPRLGVLWEPESDPWSFRGSRGRHHPGARREGMSWYVSMLCSACTAWKSCRRHGRTKR